MNRRQLLLGASAVVVAKMMPSPLPPSTTLQVGGRTLVLPSASNLSVGTTYTITNESYELLWINYPGDRILLPGDEMEFIGADWTSTRDPAEV